MHRNVEKNILLTGKINELFVDIYIGICKHYGLSALVLHSGKVVGWWGFWFILKKNPKEITSEKFYSKIGYEPASGEGQAVYQEKVLQQSGGHGTSSPGQ